ncbi:hypothetical protein BWD08_04550 [Neisseria animaloris]|nr:hypothetical protein BWD08_04550 [Neisseria animaloris]
MKPERSGNNYLIINLKNIVFTKQASANLLGKNHAFIVQTASHYTRLKQLLFSFYGILSHFKAASMFRQKPQI